jgi:hypothetical protein
MKIPASKLAAILEATVKGIREAACALQKEGITLQMDEDVIVEFDVVADDGINAIERVTTEKSGEQTRTEFRPEMLTVKVEDGHTITTTEAPGVNTRTETRTSEPSTRKDTKPGYISSVVTKDDGSVDSETTSHESSGTSAQVNNGGDVVVQEYEVESS